MLTVDPVDADALDDRDEEHGEAGRVVVHQLQHVHPALKHKRTNVKSCRKLGLSGDRRTVYEIYIFTVLFVMDMYYKKIVKWELQGHVKVKYIYHYVFTVLIGGLTVFHFNLQDNVPKLMFTFITGTCF